MRRISLATGMATVGFIAVAIAAMTHPTLLWASSLFTLAVAVLCCAVVASVIRRRAFWMGFATFGWVYLVLSFNMFNAKGMSTSSFPSRPLFPCSPPFLTVLLINYLQAKWVPETVPPSGFAFMFNCQTDDLFVFTNANYLTFHQIGHSLLSLIVAMAGGFLAAMLDRKAPVRGETAP